MSTLLIEGGHRLERPRSGRGQQERSAAAAGRMPADRGGVRAHERAAHRRRRGDGAAAARPRRRGRRHRHDDAADSRATGQDACTRRSLVGRLRGSVLLLGPLLARTGRAHIAPPGGDFPGAAHHFHASRARCRRWVRAIVSGDDHVLEAPDGSEERVDVSLRSVGDRAPRPRCWPRRRATRVNRDPPRRHRAARRRAVRVPGEDGRAASAGIGSSKLRIEGVPRLHGASIDSAATTSRQGAGRSSRRSPAARLRSTARGKKTSRSSPSVLKRMNVQCGMQRRRRSRSSRRSRRRSAASRPGLWPAFPSDLVSLVTVLATQAEGRTLVHDWMYELRLFALEQMSGMGADMFLADAHRIIVTGPTQLRGGRMLDTPRSAIRHVADRRGPRGGRSDARGAARDGRARLQPAGRSAEGARREGREGRVGGRRGEPDTAHVSNRARHQVGVADVLGRGLRGEIADGVGLGVIALEDRQELCDRQ